jgi:acetolactate synthase-1/2/3 large subunit
MTVEAQETTTLHGGRLVARRLKAYGVSKLFTLSGGHLFSIYDGCRAEGIDLVDVRHESAATFAAEGWAKVTREPGVAALTAGPGVTNGMSAIASPPRSRTTRRCSCSAAARRRCAGGRARSKRSTTCRSCAPS